MLQQEAKEVADKLGKQWMIGKFPEKTFYCFH
jgi:hypothetical protein